MASVKCRKCRNLLLEGGVNPTLSCCHSFDLCYAVDEESPPEWMTSYLDKGNWVKGRIDCNKCGAKIGAFNFVSGQHCSCGQSLIPPIFLHQRKIDVHHPAVKQTAVDANVAPMPRVSEPPKTRSHRKSQSWHGSVRNTLDLLIGSLLPARSVENVAATVKESVQQVKKAKPMTNVAQMPVLNEQEGREFPDSLLCPVCLDLLCQPYICYPCGHTFCEVCLRLLTACGSDPMEISCPMCRRLIRCCIKNSDLETLIRAQYCESYQDRLAGRLVDLKRKANLPGHGSFHHIHRLIRVIDGGVIEDRRLYRLWWFLMSPLLSLRPLVNVVFFMTIFFFLLFVPGVCLSSYLIDRMKIYGKPAMAIDPMEDQFEPPVMPLVVQIFQFFCSALSGSSLALLLIGVTFCIVLYSMAND